MHKMISTGTDRDVDRDGTRGTGSLERMRSGEQTRQTRECE
jgi:hypothetical protein